MTAAILIVEDIETKRLSIEQLVRGIVPVARLHFAASVKSAINVLDRVDFSLILLDMSLPTFDLGKSEAGGTPRPKGGMELFAHLDGSGLKVPVIVVSAYGALEEKGAMVSLDEISERLERDFPSLFIGSVLYDSVYTVWAEELTTLILKVIADGSAQNSAG